MGFTVKTLQESARVRVLWDDAATHIQKMWRGSQVRFFEPSKQQMRPSPLGHETLRGNLDRINVDSPFWSSEYKKPKMKEISFDVHQVSKDMDSGKVNKNFSFLIDGTEKTSFLFAKVIDAAFSKKSVHHFFSHPQSKCLDEYFTSTLESLESGERVSLWDGHSTKIPVHPNAVEKVKTCYVQYQFFMKSSSSDEQPLTAPPSQNQRDLTVRVDDLEQRFQELLESGPVMCTVKPRLARVAPRSVYCFPKHEPVKDDLEERLQRLLNLPNEVVVLAKPVQEE